MKKVDLVLSGGGARGLAHAGVLRVLEEEGVEIACIAGTSAGALIGALYASCLDAKKVDAFVRKLTFYKLPEFSFSKLGLMKGDRVEKMVAEFIGVEEFKDLKIPLIINATNLTTGKEMVFTTGKIIDALGATIAYPGIIRPKKWNGQLLIDGGVVNPLPFDLLPGRKPMILSDTSSESTLFEKEQTVLGMLKQSVNILQQSVINEKLKTLKKSYVLIKPNLEEWDTFEIKNDPKIITRGITATRKQLPAIKKMLS